METEVGIVLPLASLEYVSNPPSFNSLLDSFSSFFLSL